MWQAGRPELLFTTRRAVSSVVGTVAKLPALHYFLGVAVGPGIFLTIDHPGLQRLIDFANAITCGIEQRARNWASSTFDGTGFPELDALVVGGALSFLLAFISLKPLSQ